jgi:hypothetical protein
LDFLLLLDNMKKNGVNKNEKGGKNERIRNRETG